MKGIILAGGNGTRISQYHDKPSKVLLEIDGKPLIISNMERISAYVDSFIVVVGKAGKEIKEVVGNVFDGKTVLYAEQTQQKGPLDALNTAIPYLDDDDVILVLGDEFLIGDNIKQCVEAFNRRYPDAILGIIPDSKDDEIRQTYSILYKGDNRVAHIEEKPKDIDFNHDRGTGYYFLSTKILSEAKYIPPRSNGQYELADLFNHFIAKHKDADIRTKRIADRAYNINTIDVLRELIG